MTLIVIIALVVMPSAISLSYYHVTKDPTFRPLGITKESLREYFGATEGTEITAVVDWNAARAGQVTRADMQTALVNSFQAKGVEVWVVFRNTSQGTMITYRIGATKIGPYPQNRAAEGISAAVAAYHMNASSNQ